MSHTVYLISVWLHIIAAMVWVGGMAALGLLMVPTLRQERFRDVATPLLHASALRFRWIGWGALAVMLVTGVLNVWLRGVPWSAWVDVAFWTSPWGLTLGLKLLLVAIVVVMSAAHDFYNGPRAIRVMEEAPDSPEARSLRKQSSWMGRLTLLLSLAIVALAVLLPRGGLG